MMGNYCIQYGYMLEFFGKKVETMDRQIDTSEIPAQLKLRNQLMLSLFSITLQNESNKK